MDSFPVAIPYQSSVAISTKSREELEEEIRCAYIEACYYYYYPRILRKQAFSLSRNNLSRQRITFNLEAFSHLTRRDVSIDRPSSTYNLSTAFLICDENDGRLSWTRLGHNHTSFISSPGIINPSYTKLRGNIDDFTVSEGEGKRWWKEGTCRSILAHDIQQIMIRNDATIGEPVTSPKPRPEPLFRHEVSTLSLTTAFNIDFDGDEEPSRFDWPIDSDFDDELHGIDNEDETPSVPDRSNERGDKYSSNGGLKGGFEAIGNYTPHRYANGAKRANADGYCDTDSIFDDLIFQTTNFERRVPPPEQIVGRIKRDDQGEIVKDVYEMRDDLQPNLKLQFAGFQAYYNEDFKMDDLD